MDLKEYFNTLERFNKLKKYIAEDENTSDVLKYLKIHAEIRALEDKLSDLSYEIKHSLNEEEKKFLYFKYRERLSLRTLEIIFNRLRSTLYRFQNQILNKLNQ